MTRTSRKPFKVEARITIWRNADGTESNLIRLFGGTKTLAIDLAEVPDLIVRLEQLYREAHDLEAYVDRMVTA